MRTIGFEAAPLIKPRALREVSDYCDKNFVAVVRSTLDCGGSTPPSSLASWRAGADHVLARGGNSKAASSRRSPRCCARVYSPWLLYAYPVTESEMAYDKVSLDWAILNPSSVQARIFRDAVVD